MPRGNSRCLWLQPGRVAPAPTPATATATAAARPWWCKQKGNTTEQGKDEDVARAGGGEEGEREKTGNGSLCFSNFT